MTETQETKSTTPLVFVGCYSKPGGSTGESIYTYRLDMSTGVLIYNGAVAGGENASYLAISPDNRLLIAVNETVSFEGQPGGGVAALGLDPATGAMSLLNQQRSHGGLPCYVSIDATQKVALISNYLGGNIALMPILADGRLGPATDIIQHS